MASRLSDLVGSTTDQWQSPAALGDNVGIAEVGRAYRQSQLVCE